MKKLIAATTTPLASIFGSGFLIIVPILCGAVGKYAVFAMAGVCALAYGVGYAIRYNIKNAEPLDELNEYWEVVPESSSLVVENGQVTISPFTPE